MAKLAIKGHKTRGNEVIEILEMFGGINSLEYNGADSVVIYFYISEENNIIKYDWDLDDYDEDTLVFTLEEFLEKYPYNVGDKVLIPEYETEVRICEMRWNSWCNYVEYKVYCNDEEDWYTAEELNKYNELCKEETMEERKYTDLRFDVDQDDKLSTEVTCDDFKITAPDNYLIGKVTKVDNGMLVEYVKKQPEYPTTYAECYDEDNTELHFIYLDKDERDLYESFIQLIRCRNVYWKIAGEQMGFGKSWEPDWGDCSDKFCITIFKNKPIFDDSQYINRILAFPTEEMRDFFYENFKDLIEAVKELL